MFSVIRSSMLIACGIMLWSVMLLPVAGQAANASPAIDALLSTLATGSDEAATAALLQLDAEPEWFLPHYEQVADAILNATGSLGKDQLSRFRNWGDYDRTPFDELLRTKKVDRKELLAFWVAECIQGAPYGERKEQVLRHFLGLVEKMLSADNVTPETKCNLLTSFRRSVFYPSAMKIVPLNGGNLAIDLYLRHTDNSSEAIVKEVFNGLCRMGFSLPSRREEIRQALIAAYPERGQFLKERDANMSLTLPPSDAPITEEEYFSLLGMDGTQLADVLRSQEFPMAGDSREIVVLKLLEQRAEKGDESTYEALFSLGEEVSDSFQGLDMITSTLGRGAARFNTDEEKADAFLSFLATRVQQSAKKSEAIEVAATVLHEAFIAGLPSRAANAPPIPGTARAVQALEALAQQSTSQEQKDRIESHITKLQDNQTRYDNEMKKRQQRGNPVNQPSQAVSE